MEQIDDEVIGSFRRDFAIIPYALEIGETTSALAAEYATDYLAGALGTRGFSPGNVTHAADPKRLLSYTREVASKDFEELGRSRAELVGPLTFGEQKYIAEWAPFQLAARLPDRESEALLNSMSQSFARRSAKLMEPSTASLDNTAPAPVPEATALAMGAFAVIERGSGYNVPELFRGLGADTAARLAAALGLYPDPHGLSAPSRLHDFLASIGHHMTDSELPELAAFVKYFFFYANEDVLKAYGGDLARLLPLAMDPQASPARQADFIQRLGLSEHMSEIVSANPAGRLAMLQAAWER
jgi:hypothetical protein